MSDFSEYIDQPVPLKKLLRGVDFVDEETAEAARTLPRLFLLAGRFRVKKMREKNRAKAQLELRRSMKGQQAREELGKDGERVTEGRVSEYVAKDKKVQELEEAFRRAEEEEEGAKMLFECYRIKRDSLKIVADLLGAEVYVSRKLEGEPTELARIKKKLRAKYGDKDTD